MYVSGIECCEKYKITKESIEAVFNQLPNHWKRNLLQEFHIIFVSKAKRRLGEDGIQTSLTIVYVISEEENIPVELIYSRLVREYLRYFIYFNNMAELVEDVCFGIITPYPETEQERADFALLLTVLATYVVDPKWAYEIDPQYAKLCEEIDRQVRGRYVPSVIQGLLVC